jgi:hypothetical protein
VTTTLLDIKEEREEKGGLVVPGRLMGVLGMSVINLDAGVT